MGITLAAALLLPFIGTALGSGAVWLPGRRAGTGRRELAGFAAGVMTAASVWSLILPALEQSGELGRLAFLPALAGIWLGFLALQWVEGWISRLRDCENLPGVSGSSAMLVIAVALHNLPEGMAVGAATAMWLREGSAQGAAGVMALSLGIALQNLPEGAIIAMPLAAEGVGRSRAFAWGVASGVVEPLGAVATLLLAGYLTPLLPFLLSFSAGAMLFVTARELIPEAAADSGGWGIGAFAAGFGVMMALDVALG